MATSVDGTDEVLVRAAAGGDADAWNRLVDTRAGLVWAIARRHELSEQEAADVSATTWLRLAESLGALSAPAGLRVWLAGTARRESLRQLARTGRLSPPVPPERERRAVPRPTSARLSSRCRELHRLLVHDPGPTYEQLAAAMRAPRSDGEPPRTARGRRSARLVGSGGAPDPSDG